MGVQIVSRDEWAAKPSRGPLQPWPDGQPTSWTLHYEAVDVDVDLPDYADRVRSIQAYHQSHGYSDIAYNWLVGPDGRVYEGRGSDVRSAAQMSGNPVSIAVCYIGGPSTPLTDAAKVAINWLIGQRPLDVVPHRHWIATACPGDAILDWLDAGRPDSGEVPAPPAPPVPGPVTPDVLPMIRPGMSGQAVVEMQDKLRVHGFDPGVSDGVYGNVTGSALRAFQSAEGIASDGICGPITWGRLDRTPGVIPAPSGSTRLLRLGDRGADVSELQEALYRAGEDAGVADGVLGNKTDAAIRRFQSSRGLMIDGIVGPQTRQALGI